MVLKNIIKIISENIPLSILFIYLPLAFTLMQTSFHYRKLLTKKKDYQAFIRYFMMFFLIFFFIPCLIIVFLSKDPAAFLFKIGFCLGDIKVGLLICLIAMPVALLISFIASKNQKIRKFYPFSKIACTQKHLFIYYELIYFIFYYFSWEFLFRGLLFFPIINLTNLIFALVIQTIISTLYHIGHPDSELYASLAAGFVFGMIAYITGSFLYTFFIHAVIGISTDTFLYRQNYQKKNK